VEQFIFVAGHNKSVIEDYFDTSYELQDILRRRGKTKELEAPIADLPKAGCASFTRQQAPLGLGHAVWCARELIGNEPFAALLSRRDAPASQQGNSRRDPRQAPEHPARADRDHGGHAERRPNVPQERLFHRHGQLQRRGEGAGERGDRQQRERGLRQRAAEYCSTVGPNMIRAAGM